MCVLHVVCLSVCHSTDGQVFIIGSRILLIWFSTNVPANVPCCVVQLPAHSSIMLMFWSCILFQLGPQADHSLGDFNETFIEAWRGTHNHRIWKSQEHAGIDQVHTRYVQYPEKHSVSKDQDLETKFSLGMLINLLG